MNQSRKLVAEIIKENEATSTNERLAELCKEKNIEEFTTLMVEFQTAGKGQRGNSWESEYGKNAIFSTVLYPRTITARNQFFLSIAISSAIFTALSDYINKNDISIKWPNDIYWKDKKIAGILIENDLMGGQISHSIVGIGININQERFHSPAPNPVSLQQITGKSMDRLEVVQKILKCIISSYDRIENNGADVMIELYKFYQDIQYRSKGYHLYCDAEGKFTAKFVKVEQDGHLVLKDLNENIRKYAFKEVQYVI